MVTATKAAIETKKALPQLPDEVVEAIVEPPVTGNEKPAAVWMVESLDQQKQTKWQPLWHSDCKNLEDALQDPSQLTRAVLGDEYTVDLAKRVMTPNFWAETPAERRVIRGTWFFKSNHGDFYPYDEVDADSLEKLWQLAPEQLKVRVCF